MNWRFVHSVWSLVWRPRKTSPGVQTLCIILLLMLAAPASANSAAAQADDPTGKNAACMQHNEFTSIVLKQASDIANMRFLLAEVLRSLDELTANAAKSGSTQQLPAMPDSPGAS